MFIDVFSDVRFNCSNAFTSLLKIDLYWKDFVFCVVEAIVRFIATITTKYLVALNAVEVVSCAFGGV